VYDHLAFFGSSEFAIPLLKSILDFTDVRVIVTQIPRMAGRNRRLTPTPVSTFAHKMGLNVVEVENVNDEGFIKLLKDLNIQLAIVVAFGQILKPTLLDSVPKGFFNVHASLLPAYRGAAPIQRALLDGVEETGITIFKIDKGLDTGKVALMESLKVDPLDTFDTLSEKLSMLGSSLIKKFMESHEVLLKDQNGEPSYAKKISSEETIINWNYPAAKIGNLIRAFDSRPGSRTILNGEMVKLFGFKGISQMRGRPGEILKINSEAIVGCEDFSIIVSKIQFPSKRVMSFGEAQNGHKIISGSSFGA
jgi:methionyl-tRNA formyltransferase